MATLSTSRIIQTKVFLNDDPLALEVEINAFLAAMEAAEIINVHYVSIAGDKEYCSSVSAMVYFSAPKP